jgi:flagellar biosynthetic protein FliR
MVALVLFLLLNGHHLVLQALWQSVELLPIGGAHLDALLLEEGIRQSGRVLTLGVQLAAPLLAALLLAEVAMGVIARTVPQMNIFIVGFPVKIALGVFMLVMTLPLLSQWLDQQTRATATLLDALVQHLAR